MSGYTEATDAVVNREMERWGVENMSGYKSRKRKTGKKIKSQKYPTGTVIRMAGRVYRADEGGSLVRISPEYAAKPGML